MIQPVSNPSLNFSFGSTNQTGTATSATPASGFSFGSKTAPTGGFNFGSTAATNQSFTFGPQGVNTSTPVFGKTTSSSSGSVFGTGTPQASATGFPFGGTGTNAAKTGLFGGTFASAPATTQNAGGFAGPGTNAGKTSLFSGTFASAPATTQNAGGFGGSQTTSQASLFNTAVTSTTQSTGFFSGKMPTATTATPLPSGGSTMLFSGYAAPASNPSFSFSAPAPSPQSGGMMFGTPKQATQGSTTGAPVFGTVTPSLNAKQTGMTLPSQETVGNPGFSLGGATTVAPSGGVTSNFGTSQRGSAGGVTFGVTPSATTTKPSATTTPATSGMTHGITQSGTPTATTQPGATSSGFKLGAAPATTAQTTPGFSFGGGSSAASATLASGTTLASKQAAQPVQNLALGQSTTGFNFSGQLGGQPKTTATTTAASNKAKPSNLGSNQNLVFAARVNSTIGPGAMPTLTTSTSSPNSTFGLLLPRTSTNTTTTGSQLGSTPASGLGTTTTSTTTGLKLPTSTAIASLPSKAATSATTSATTTATTTTTSSEKYTYKQLEEQVNKWNIELEDMEKAFLEQAAQVNVADRELMENGEKIAVLHNEVERAKAEQSRLDQELDFLVSQQNELEDLLKPLEESVKQHSIEYTQEPDREREKIYAMAENCDAQLKGMVQDLKEVIDHLNASNASQQEEDNPVIQIAKILNVHMDSLQWIDQNSALLQKRVDEISRLSDMRRKDHERSFRLGFD